MSTFYDEIRQTALDLLTEFGSVAGINLLLYEGTIPDASKPWRQTEVSPTTTTTFGVALPDEEGPPNYTVYIEGTAGGVTLDERYIIEIGDAHYTISAAVPLDPDGSGPVLWTCKATRWPQIKDAP